MPSSSAQLPLFMAAGGWDAINGGQSGRDELAAQRAATAARETRRGDRSGIAEVRRYGAAQRTPCSANYRSVGEETFSAADGGRFGGVRCGDRDSPRVPGAAAPNPNADSRITEGRVPDSIRSSCLHGQ